MSEKVHRVVVDFCADEIGEIDKVYEAIEKLLVEMGGIGILSAEGLIDFTACDHAHYDFKSHGRHCPCGALMVDFGD